MESPYDKYLNPIIQFNILSHLYTKTQLKPNSRKFKGSEPVYSIWQAKQEIEYPGIIIFDKEGYIDPSDQELALIVIDEEKTIEQYVTFVSPRAKKKIKGTLEENGYTVSKDNEDTISKPLAKSQICYRPINKIRDIWSIDELDWEQFIDKIIRWDAINKDPRLNHIHKAQLLEGLDQRLNAHALVVLNAGVGKSIHFNIHGIQIDKATRKSFLGFAKSPEEVYPGTVANSRKPIGIDQIEVGEWGILDFMFNVMEYGEGTVSAGAFKFTVKTRSPFTLNANPISDKLNPEKNFGIILDHLTRNPAIARRFAVIAYDTNYNVLNTKSTPESLRAWKKASNFFRAVEQYARPLLHKIKEAPEIWEWLNTPIPGYQDKIKEVTKSCQDNGIKQFFEEHGKAGQSRVRAAALQCSLVDYLQDIALERVEIEQIIEHAEDQLPTFIQINIESANNIVQSASNLAKFAAEVFLNSQPAYIQEIIYAAEFTKRQTFLGSVFILNDAEYRPSNDSYQYISQCINKLADRKRGIVQLNNALAKHFKFRFELQGKNLEMIYLDKTPIPWIKIPGHDEETDIETPKPELDLEPTPRERIDILYDHFKRVKQTKEANIALELGWTLDTVQKTCALLARDALIYKHLDEWRLMN